MNKSFISVKVTLTIVIIIVLVIGLVSVVFLFFPWWERGVSCIQFQRTNIDRINTAIEEVLLTGEEQIIRFRVEDCTMCIWYNGADASSNIHILEIEYEAANESFSTPVAWAGVDIESGCTSPGRLVGRGGQKVCTVDITVNPPQAQVVAC